ncbi:cysteine-rich receptor-like protein kinase 10 [Rhodamnia argentea]|uniref:Cysteine-rich receptor-like protein kinase 10 n=1 Tax=Rhodamnia argentea TaxID=178133 RepID=A0ABM3H8J8_9MYRT|nr:cysteine-rich receptor-like protein kinase 10 [Rhodamnia argentea]
MKSCFAFSISLSFLLVLLSVYTPSSESAPPNYLDHYCPNETLFAPNSTYQSNLNTLLSNLSSAATADTDGFANATAGQNPPDEAYGLFLCRGDVNASTCSDCVATAKQDILRICPNQRVSVIWYDECMLRYSNQSIFSVEEELPSLMMWNPGNITDPAKFVQVLGDAIKDVAWRASVGESGKKFAVGEANFTSSQTLYTLAQCTPDLTAWDCNTCLRSVIPGLPEGKQGGRKLTPSCAVRFELYPFYNISALLAPPPPPVTTSEGPLPPPVTIPEGKCDKSAVIIVAIIVPVGGVLVLLFLTRCFLRRKGKKTNEAVKGMSGAIELTTKESLQFDLATIRVATNDFSPENKLGEGGFGEVFRGCLPDGQQIAVKRLSQSSRQGDDEFKNEVQLVAKLQHGNLVRLLGFCLDGVEKLLAYEFVPNKSLDYFLFDPQRSSQLNWPLRYKVISGIARGMLYLHEDSRLRIIHCDLKCSNILLDSEMNPKISVFGMARSFGVDQTQASTNKIVGTFGYMSPEYAMHGEFSVESNVYSFGILLLEIICGKKNNFYQQLGRGEYLATYVWNQWRDGTPLKVLDPVIAYSYSRDEVLRCLHIGLLCIQEDPAIRPTMATVVLMLSSSSFSRLRGLSIPTKELESDQSTSRTMPSSSSGVSVTEFNPW